MGTYNTNQNIKIYHHIGQHIKICDILHRPLLKQRKTKYGYYSYYYDYN